MRPPELFQRLHLAFELLEMYLKEGSEAFERVARIKKEFVLHGTVDWNEFMAALQGLPAFVINVMTGLRQAFEKLPYESPTLRDHGTQRPK